MWWEQLGRSRVARKVLAKVMKLAVSRAWCMWETRVAEGRHMRHVEPQVGKRWRWRCFATSWASWQRAHLGLTRLKQFQARIQLRCNNRILSCALLEVKGSFVWKTETYTAFDPDSNTASFIICWCWCLPLQIDGSAQDWHFSTMGPQTFCSRSISLYNLRPCYGCLDFTTEAKRDSATELCKTRPA